MSRTDIVRCGKTLRKTPKSITRNALLELKFANSDKESIELFNCEFSKHVSYTTKKKKRWMLPSYLSTGLYNEDQSIVYCKHQCLVDQTPRKTIYIYDSVSDQQYGSIDAPNKKLKRSGFNGSSMMKSLTNQFDHTNREMENFDKSKLRPKTIETKSRKNHRQTFSYYPQFDDKLPQKVEHIQDLEKRKDCMYLNEYVYMDSSFQFDGLIRNQNRKYKQSIRNKTKSGTCKSKKKHQTLSKILENQEIDDDYDDIEEQMKCTNVNLFRVPFKLDEKDLMYRKEKIEKKRKRKRSFVRKTLSKVTKDFNHIHDTVDSDEIQKIDVPYNISLDVFPFIEINLHQRSFISDLNAITESHKCWLSDTLPTSILVDLSKSDETCVNNYLILKPIIVKEFEFITLKVLFNFSNFDMNTMTNKSFSNLRNLIKYMHANWEPSYLKSVRSQKLLTIDKPIQELSNIWRTKNMENLTELYRLHPEWKNHIFPKDNINDFVLNLQEMNDFSMDTCEICFCDSPIDEIVTIRVCEHKFCQSCFCNYMVHRLETGMKCLNCPGTNCSRSLDCATILSLVSWNRYCKRLKNLETLVNKRLGTKCFVCEAVTVMNLGDTNTNQRKLEYKCACGNIICSTCGKGQHWPNSCYGMRKHNDKLRTLKDVEIFSEKRDPIILVGINCPNCMYFIEKFIGCNQMICACGTEFCWLCGDCNNEGNHESAHFPCFDVQANNLQTFDISNTMPDPSDVRPKMYILSLEQRINSSARTVKMIFSQITKITNTKSNFYSPQFDVRDIEIQFIQLMKVTEFLFVKAYQLKKKKQYNLLNYLKNSASHLLFYQKQIKIIVETISHYTDLNDGSKEKVNENCIRIMHLFSGAKEYIGRIHRVLEN